MPQDTQTDKLQALSDLLDAYEGNKFEGADKDDAHALIGQLTADLSGEQPAPAESERGVGTDLALIAARGLARFNQGLGYMIEQGANAPRRIMEAVTGLELGDAGGFEGVAEFGRSLQSKPTFQGDPAHMAEAEQVVADMPGTKFITGPVAQGAGSAAGFALSSLAGVGPAAAGAIVSISSGVEEAQRSGASPGRTAVYAALQGLIGTSEALGASGAVSRVGKSVVSDKLRHAATTMAEEAAQEWAQNVLGDVAARTTIDPQRTVDWRGAFEQALAAAPVGFGAGAVEAYYDHAKTGAERRIVFQNAYTDAATEDLRTKAVEGNIQDTADRIVPRGTQAEEPSTGETATPPQPPEYRTTTDIEHEQLMAEARRIQDRRRPRPDALRSVAYDDMQRMLDLHIEHEITQAEQALRGLPGWNEEAIDGYLERRFEARHGDEESAARVRMQEQYIPLAALEKLKAEPPTGFTTEELMEGLRLKRLEAEGVAPELKQKKAQAIDRAWKQIGTAPALAWRRPGMRTSVNPRPAAPNMAERLAAAKGVDEGVLDDLRPAMQQVGAETPGEILDAFAASGVDPATVERLKPYAVRFVEEQAPPSRAAEQELERAADIQVVEAVNPTAPPITPAAKKQRGFAEIRKRARSQPKTVREFLAAIGGLKYDPNFERFTKKEGGREMQLFGLGPVVRGPKSAGGVHWDTAMRMLEERGFLPDEGAMHGPRTHDIDTMIDAIASNLVHPDFVDDASARVYGMPRPGHTVGEAQVGSETPPDGGGIAQPVSPVFAAPNPVEVPDEELERLRAPPRVIAPDQVVHWRDVQDALAAFCQAIGVDPAIRVGWLKFKTSAGEFNTHTGVIRLLRGNTMDVLAHEVGHATEALIFGGPASSYFSEWVDEGSGISGPNPILRELEALGRELYGSKQPAAGYIGEGWAQFINFYVTDRARAQKKASATLEWFDKSVLARNRAAAGHLDLAAENWSRWNAMKPMEREEATRVDPSTSAQRWREKLARARRFFSKEQHLDEAEAIHEISREVARKYEEKGATPPSPSPSEVVTAMRGIGSSVFATMERRFMPNEVGQRVGQSFEEATARLKNKGKNGLLAAYLRSKRIAALWDHRRRRAERLGVDVRSLMQETSLSESDARAIVEEIEREHQDVAATAEAIWGWWEQLNDYVAATSVQARAVVESLRANDPGFYAPLRKQVFDAVAEAWVRGGRFTRGAGTTITKRFTGSHLNTLDPTIELLREGARRVSWAHELMISDTLFEAQAVPGMGRFLEKLDPKKEVAYRATLSELASRLRGAIKEGGGELELDWGDVDQDALVSFFAPSTVTRSGDPIVKRFVRKAIVDAESGITTGYRTEVELYATSPELYAALSSLQDHQYGGLVRALRQIRQVAVLGIIARPAYALVTAPLRDFPTLMLNSRYMKNPGDVLKLWVGSMAAWPFYAVKGKAPAGIKAQLDLYAGLGLEGAHMLGDDISRAHSSRRAALGGKPLVYMDAKTWPSAIYRMLVGGAVVGQEVVQTSEIGGRFAEFRAGLREMGWDPSKPLTVAQAMQLRIAAKQITFDPTAAGTFARQMNQITPFYNVAIQAPLSSVRAYQRAKSASEEAGRVGAALNNRFVLTGVAALTVPTILLWLLNRDKDWYKDHLSDNETYGYWHFEYDLFGAKGVLRIPRPHLEGGVFAALPEALLNAWYAKDPHSAVAWAEQFARNAKPGLLPPLLEEPWEQIAGEGGRDFYTGMPIVPSREVEGPLDEQYDEYTTDASIEIGRVLGVSPRRIDHVLRTFTGGLGESAAAAVGGAVEFGVDLFGGPKAEGAVGRGGDLPTKDFEMADVPVVGTLFVRGGTAPSGSPAIEELYELRKTYDTEGRSRFVKETAAHKAVRDQLDKAAFAISACLSVRRSITKKADREALQLAAVKIAKKAVADEHNKRLTPGFFDAQKSYWGSRKEAQRETDKQRLLRMGK